MECEVLGNISIILIVRFVRRAFTHIHHPKHLQTGHSFALFLHTGNNSFLACHLPQCSGTLIEAVAPALL